MHKPGRKIVPAIQDPEEWVKERHSDPVADGETPLLSASLGRHNQKTVFLPRITRLHPSEHSVGGITQDKKNVPNEKQITEVMHNILQIGTSRVLSKLSGNLLTPIWFFHGALSSNSIPGKDHDHWAMVQQ